VAYHVFGKNSKVIFLGSRVDDTRKGGDIDLYIQPRIKENLSEKKINFLAELKSDIGDLNFDIKSTFNADELINIYKKENR